jgi:hypothetical protein
MFRHFNAETLAVILHNPLPPHMRGRVGVRVEGRNPAEIYLPLPLRERVGVRVEGRNPAPSHQIRLQSPSRLKKRRRKK